MHTHAHARRRTCAGNGANNDPCRCLAALLCCCARLVGALSVPPAIPLNAPATFLLLGSDGRRHGHLLGGRRRKKISVSLAFKRRSGTLSVNPTRKKRLLARGKTRNKAVCVGVLVVRLHCHATPPLPYYGAGRAALAHSQKVKCPPYSSKGPGLAAARCHSDDAATGGSRGIAWSWFWSCECSVAVLPSCAWPG